MIKRPVKGRFLCVLWVLLFLSISICSAQKIVKKTILSSSISTIAINTENCYKVEIASYEGDEIIVKANIEGEYKQDLLVQLKEQENTVQISANFQPVFVNPNDKLSAHKVVSIVLYITVPKNKKVLIKGYNTLLSISGKYKELQVNIKEGICSLIKISGYVSIQTQKATIDLKESCGKVKSYSKYGKLEQEVICQGKSKFILRTVTGDIHIKK